MVPELPGQLVGDAVGSGVQVLRSRRGHETPDTVTGQREGAEHTVRPEPHGHGVRR